MDKDFLYFMVPFLLITLCFIIPILIISLPDMFPTYEMIEGTVVDIQISSGGFMSPDLTTLFFDDGRVITFNQIHNEFQIGKTYTIIYHKSGIGANKIVEVVEQP